VAALPGSQVFTFPGGHDWDTWRRLWAEILDMLGRRWEASRSDKNNEGWETFPAFIT
jgi:hypothetical protein